MSNLALISIIFGLLIIVGRAPLVIAPAVTLRLVRRFINEKSNLRFMGIPTAILGVTMICFASGADQPAAMIIIVFGWIIAIAAVLELFITSHIQRLAIYIWGMSDLTARILGLFSVLLGAYLIYLGYAVF